MKNTTIRLAEEHGAYLSGRFTAARLRKDVTSSGVPVTVDLAGVESLSDSFADEFFAVLVEEFGHEWFASNVVVRGMTPDVRHTVLRAVHLRCELEAAG